MKKRKRFLAASMAILMGAGMFACSSPENTPSQQSAGSSSAAAAKDTVTALLPPVSANYQKRFDEYVKDFNSKYPNLTLEIQPTSWEDVTQKLDTEVNAGNPQDIAFIGSDSISKYVQQGVLVDISKIATDDMKNDFDKGPLEYMKNGSGLYGFPAYMEIHCLGGNKQFLEKAGIDWKSVQKNGWTFDEFREAVKKGVVKDGDKVKTYGFVFACSGVTSKDYLTMMAKEAGMPAAFDKDQKYTYTSKNFLEMLKGLRELIDDGSMPKELNSVDAGRRWNMFLTGQTMITGKGMANFENSAKLNNAKLDSKDSGAVEGSIKVDYVVLPMPTFGTNPQQATPAVDGYVIFRGKQEPTPEHEANVVKAAYFLSSGKVAAETNSELFCEQITNTGRDAAKDIKMDRDADNEAAVQTLIKQSAPARPDIPAELGAKATQIEDEVLVPKFQALLANEITPQQMYDAVKQAAVEAFGDDGIVKD